MTRRTAALPALLALALAGCPGRIEDPERFLGATVDSAVAACTLGVGDVESQIIRARCATADCHERSARAGGLDLESPGVASRLVGVAARGCAGRVLVAPSAPATSYLLDKLNPSPRCGARMPLASQPLSPSEVACVRAWVDSLLVDGGAPRMDASMDAPADVRIDAPVDARPDAADAPDVRDVTDAPDADVPRDADPSDADAPDAGDAPDDADVTDAAEDATLDATPDATVDDAPADSAPDATPDVRDAAPDARDAAPDARDASVDAPLDAAPE